MSTTDLPPWPEPIRELDPSEDDLTMWRNDMIHALRARLALALGTIGDLTNGRTVTIKRLNDAIAACKEPS